VSRRADASPLRRARERDLERLVALFFVLLEYHAERSPRLALRGSAEAEEQVRRLLTARLRDGDSRVLVWDEAGDLLGLCIARILRRPAIFDAGLAWMCDRGIRRAEIQVAAENAGARDFWRALGFKAAMDVLERRL